MKFFHLSDLHLGLRLAQKSLAEDQKHILRQIAALAQERQPEAIVIAGDVYDRADPPAEAVGLFDDFLGKLRAAVPEAEIMVISGNHDSAQRLNLYRGFLAREHVQMIGLPPQHEGEQIARVTLEDAFGPVYFYLLPFVKPAMVQQLVAAEDEGRLSYDEALHRLLAREKIDATARNVLVSHQFYLPAGKTAEDAPRATSEVRAVGNLDAIAADVLAPFDYAALGHIHKKWHWGDGRYRYCGAPLATSFSEADTVKHLAEVTLRAKGEVSVEEIPLVPLHPVRILRGTLAQLLEKPSADYVRVELAAGEGLLETDVQARLRAAFPNLLEIRREGTRDYAAEEISEELEEAAPLDLCRAFLGSLTEEEENVLAEAITAAQEAAE